MTDMIEMIAIDIIEMTWTIGKIVHIISSIIFIILSGYEWYRLRSYVRGCAEISDTYITIMRSDIKRLTERVQACENKIRN